MLECAALDNDEVVGLADDFVARHEAQLREVAAVKRHGRRAETPPPRQPLVDCTADAR